MMSLLLALLLLPRGNGAAPAVGLSRFADLPAFASSSRVRFERAAFDGACAATASGSCGLAPLFRQLDAAYAP